MFTSRFTRRLAMMFGATWLLVALVLLMFQLSATAIQSMSAGIIFPIEHITLLFLCMALGLLSVNARSHEMVVLPLGFLFMLVASLGLHLGFLPVTSKPIVLAAASLLLFAVALAYGARMLAVVALSTIAAVAVTYMPQAEIAETPQALYFMLGVSITSLILLASGLCFGFTIRGLKPPSTAKKPSAIVYRPILTLN